MEAIASRLEAIASRLAQLTRQQSALALYGKVESQLEKWFVELIRLHISRGIALFVGNQLCSRGCPLLKRQETTKRVPSESKGYTHNHTQHSTYKQKAGSVVIRIRIMPQVADWKSKQRSMINNGLGFN